MTAAMSRKIRGISILPDDVDADIELNCPWNRLRPRGKQWHYVNLAAPDHWQSAMRRYFLENLVQVPGGNALRRTCASGTHLVQARRSAM